MSDVEDKIAGEDRSLEYAPEIVALLHGAHFLLMGFEPLEFIRIADVLSSAGAISVQAPFEPRMLESCHAIIASIPALAEIQPRPATMPPLLIVGTPEDIAVNIAGQSLTGVDFLATTWTSPELIVRAFRLLASSSRGQARVQGCERPRILIADDDPDIAALLKTTLYHHAECQVVGNGLAAVRAVRESPPDVLILDVNMPILNGFEVLQTIRKDPGLRRLPVILLTASDGKAEVRRGMDLGADDYIVKPFGVNTLVQRIRRLLTGSLDACRESAGHGL